MLKRFLLHFTHDLVGVVDGGGDLRTIAVFHFHRFGQMGIGGPHLEFERLAARLVARVFDTLPPRARIPGNQ